MSEPSGLIGLILLSNVAVAAVFLAGAGLVEWRRQAQRRRVSPDEGDFVYLFRDEALIDATPAARRVLAAAELPGSDWQRFLAVHQGEVPDLQREMARLVERGQVEIAGTNRVIRAAWVDGVARISVRDIGAAQDESRVSSGLLKAARREAGLLRETLNALPALVWHENMTGQILWANDAYLARVAMTLPSVTERAWPPPRLFEADLGDLPPEGEIRRMRLTHGEAVSWYDVHAQLINGRYIMTATSADRVVAAERERRDFVQTLTKTFSQLSFGLAVFDKTRRLGLFNPALTQMTRLDAEFLVARPTLMAFLDQLREKRIIPEPRDYLAWRNEISDAALSPGQGYEANWLTASGQTFRVCGRTQADGSFALTFEDVSREVSLTRRHRDEIELAQSALDAVDDPLAVFSETGGLSLTNAAFDATWGIDPSSLLGQFTVHDMIRLWQGKCLPSQVWGELCDLISGHEPRADWSAKVMLKDGSELSVQVEPAANGATLVMFSTRDIPVVNFATRRGLGAAPVN